MLSRFRIVSTRLSSVYRRQTLLDLKQMRDIATNRPEKQRKDLNK